MCSWKRQTPMNGLSRAGLPAARPVEEVSATVALWFLWGVAGVGENEPETGRSLEEVFQYVLEGPPCLQAIPSRVLGEAGATGQAVCSAVQSHFCTGDRGRSPVECSLSEIEG